VKAAAWRSGGRPRSSRSSANTLLSGSAEAAGWRRRMDSPRVHGHSYVEANYLHGEMVAMGTPRN
jgi:hypothetical protein